MPDGETYNAPTLPDFLPDSQKTFLSQIKYQLEDPSDPDIQEKRLQSVKPTGTEKKRRHKLKETKKKIEEEGTKYIKVGTKIFAVVDETPADVRKENIVSIPSESSNESSSEDEEIVEVDAVSTPPMKRKRNAISSEDDDESDEQKNLPKKTRTETLAFLKQARQQVGLPLRKKSGGDGGLRKKPKKDKKKADETKDRKRGVEN